MSVTIGSDDYETYGTLAGLATYANGSFTWAATYTAASSDNAKRALVEATRLLNAQEWDGELTSDGQALAWPRDGVSALPPSGVAVTDGVTPTEIVNACYELALAMLANVAVVAGTSTASNVSQVTAGPVSVAFAYPKTGGRFPDRVMELVGWAFGSAASSDLGPLGVYATGTDGCSQFDDADRYRMNGA